MRKSMHLLAPSSHALGGAYPAERAAALAGVPKSTVYYWARKGIIIPSISQTRERLWSYADLMALRIVYWLRHQKMHDDDIIKRTPMSQVRKMLSLLDKRNVNIWEPSGTVIGTSPILVDRSGTVLLETDAGQVDTSGQLAIDREFCSLLGPFELDTYTGPDLVRPRPSLRIIPGKLSGEPHISDSRVSTQTLNALEVRGLDLEAIGALYPSLSDDGIADAIDLESQLSRNAAA